MKWLFTALLAGLFVAGPFLTTHSLGTKEAYNYSLATADAVTQFRAGEVPMLVGQSDYAFNGRIHPLRTAPGLAYTACILDLITFRQLSFWTLQNLVLGLGLVGTAAAAFWSLRWSTRASPPTVAMLTTLFVLSPALLAAAYGMDLYMTILAAPTIPIIVAANVSALDDRNRSRSLLLGVALAACWLAHPPVALWMTIVTVIIQAFASIVCRPSASGWGQIAFGAFASLMLAAYGLVSALSASPYADIVHQRDLSLLLTEVQRVFQASLHPVSTRADQLGDFQLGYAIWLLAAVALVAAVIRRSMPGLLLLGVAAFLAAFTLPIPIVHTWLWDHAPTLVLNLTNQWPMQRIYPPIAALVITSFALVWKHPATKSRLGQDVVRIGVIAIVGWSLWQGWHFVSRGYATRATAEETAVSHLPSNLDLTPISYALLGTPPDFTNGPVDPAFGLRLLAPYDAHPLITNLTAPISADNENRNLTLTARPGETGDILNLTGTLTLQPGLRYRLTFNFLAPPQPATLQIMGTALHREYPLPSSGGARSFGMVPGNHPVLSLWTDLDTAEQVRFRLVAPGLAESVWRGRPFADLKVEVIRSGNLPMELISLLPLKVKANAPTPGYLETPRMFIPGYSAIVNGVTARIQPSPDRKAMVAVPAGKSTVEVRYPGSIAVRASFWLSVIAWFGLTVVGLIRLCPNSKQNAASRLLATCRHMLSRPGWRTLLVTASVTVMIAAAILGFSRWSAWRAAVGPIRVEFVLPHGETNRQQPLVVTGRPNAGLFIYVIYYDQEHVRIGVDSWGRFGYQSDPIKTDYFAEHELVVDAGSLYPHEHPGLANIPANALDALRRKLRITFDGQLILDENVDTHTSTPGNVTVGQNLIGGSSCEPSFAGQILSVERLSIPNR